jgi:hypothetical protein
MASLRTYRVSVPQCRKATLGIAAHPSAVYTRVSNLGLGSTALPTVRGKPPSPRASDDPDWRVRLQLGGKLLGAEEAVTIKAVDAPARR